MLAMKHSYNSIKDTTKLFIKIQFMFINKLPENIERKYV